MGRMCKGKMTSYVVDICMGHQQKCNCYEVGLFLVSVIQVAIILYKLAQLKLDAFLQNELTLFWASELSFIYL